MEKSGKTAKAEKAIPDGTEEMETCGIVMPISGIDGCEPAHWVNVREILEAAARSAGYEPQMVSTGAHVGVIQGRIVQNLYDNPIVVCDVSGKNPNVMFELGMRLAFDKPVIIVKDDMTSYSFDTSPIEHLEYRRDLRYQNVVEFQKLLAQRITATVEKSRTDEGYSPFLRQFGKFTVSKLETQEVSSNEYLVKKIDALQQEISKVSSTWWNFQASRRANNAAFAGGDRAVAYLVDPTDTESLARGYIYEELQPLSLTDLKDPEKLRPHLASLKKRTAHLDVSEDRMRQLLLEYGASRE